MSPTLRVVSAYLPGAVSLDSAEVAGVMPTRAVQSALDRFFIHRFVYHFHGTVRGEGDGFQLAVVVASHLIRLNVNEITEYPSLGLQ